MMLWTRLLCVLGYHDYHPDLNASYDYCIRCRHRVKAC